MSVFVRGIYSNKIRYVLKMAIIALPLCHTYGVELIKYNFILEL